MKIKRYLLPLPMLIISLPSFGLAQQTITIVSGDAQIDTVAQALPDPFVISITDGGVPQVGVSVTFTIVDEPAGATGQTLSTGSTTTNASGEASTILTLGDLVGTYTVEASAAVAGSPVTFTSTGTADNASTISLTSGNNQSKTVDQALDNAFVVTVTDQFSNPVSGVSVTFAINTVPSGATGQSLSVTNATTNAIGQASSVLTLGGLVGTYTVTASSTGLTGSPVTFTATGTADNPTTISFTSGNTQIKTVGQALDDPFVVTVTDQFSNPVSGVSVTFAITGVPSAATGQIIKQSKTFASPWMENKL